MDEEVGMDSSTTLFSLHTLLVTSAILAGIINLFNTDLVPSFLVFGYMTYLSYLILIKIFGEELSILQNSTLALLLCLCMMILTALIINAITGSINFFHLETVFLFLSGVGTLALFSVWEIPRIDFPTLSSLDRSDSTYDLIMFALSLLIYITELREPITIPSTYGLWNRLSPFFYLGFALALVGLTRSILRNRRISSLLGLFLILFYTHFLSIAITRTASIHTGLQFISHMQYIINNQSINSDIMWYHTWPGFFVPTGLLTYEWAESSRLMLLIIHPFFYRIVNIALLLQLSSLFLEEKPGIDYPVLVVSFYTLADWVYQDYFAPQTLATLFLLQVLILLFQIKPEKGFSRSSVGKAVLIGVLAVTSFRTHLLTTAFIVAFIGFFTAFHIFALLQQGRLSKDSIRSFYRSHRNQIIIATIIITAISSILLYVFLTSTWFQEKGLRFLSFIFGFEPRALLKLIDSAGGISERIVSVIIRLIMSTIVGGLWLISIISIFRRYRRDESTRATDEVLKINLIAFTLITFLTTFLVFIYSDELFHRMYLYSLPFISLIISKFVENIKGEGNKVISILLIFFMLSALFIPAKFGNERVNLLYDGEIEGVQFMDRHYNGTSVIGYQQHLPVTFCYSCHEVFELRRPERSNYANWSDSDQRYYHILDINQFDDDPTTDTNETERYDRVLGRSTFNKTHLIYLSKSYMFRSNQFDLDERLLYNTILNNVRSSPNYELVFEQDDTVIYVLTD